MNLTRESDKSTTVNYIAVIRSSKCSVVCLHSADAFEQWADGGWRTMVEYTPPPSHLDGRCHANGDRGESDPNNSPCTYVHLYIQHTVATRLYLSMRGKDKLME